MEQSDSASMDTVLERLRQAPAGGAPQIASRGFDVARGPDSGAPGANPSATPGAEPAYAQPRQIGPRARLGMARSAIKTGRIEDARQYLEGAQLQLVFRPVSPTGDDRTGGSRVAGDVASALSMLGAGNTDGALQYINRAMDEAPAPQGYGYDRPSGGAPLAEAGR
jgi:hypothetical protein